ncbi:hypothetical protein OBBRIDRAFT_121659 [Obba rivulosa]|uniref:Uncharacterized protein n=1 Tax=Obba rivulosa TaxID=1052685 RepID=A0A8E2DRJ6_9APHY|nr:hypothetical protein OBBRIDRAFT_121659 [Obba rivulosa]
MPSSYFPASPVNRHTSSLTGAVHDSIVFRDGRSRRGVPVYSLCGEDIAPDVLEDPHGDVHSWINSFARGNVELHIRCFDVIDPPSVEPPKVDLTQYFQKIDLAKFLAWHLSRWAYFQVPAGMAYDLISIRPLGKGLVVDVIHSTKAAHRSNQTSARRQLLAGSEGSRTLFGVTSIP